VKPIVIDQTVHGYRDGHRLLRSSLSLPTDATRTLLVMSDMSGPSMQPGFDEYLTGYPLRDQDCYVLGKTWYAPEMKRPGCVWTHSLLIGYADLAKIANPRSLLSLFVRPEVDNFEAVTIEPLTLSLDYTHHLEVQEYIDQSLIALMVDALYNDSTRPVLVYSNNSSVLENALLAIWSQQWPRVRMNFSFCSGALSPRMCHGALLDLQIIPRNISISHLRKVSPEVIFLDLAGTRPSPSRGGLQVIVDDLLNVEKSEFRSWLSTCAEYETNRSLIVKFADLFQFWSLDQMVDAHKLLQATNAELGDSTLKAGTVVRLLHEIFNHYAVKQGTAGEFSVLFALAVGDGSKLFSEVVDLIQEKVKILYVADKHGCLTLLYKLLGCGGLSSLGEKIVLALFTNMNAEDALEFESSRPGILSTLLRANPRLACSLEIWSHPRLDKRELIASVGVSNSLTRDLLRGIIEAMVKAGVSNVAEDFVRGCGDLAIYAVLDSARSGDIELDWDWVRILRQRTEAVVRWLEANNEKSSADLNFIVRMLNPNDEIFSKRLIKIWTNYLDRIGDANEHDSLVAAFGLALGFAATKSGILLVAFFQDVYNALETNSLDYIAWSWLKEQAPALSWWRDWDKCERLASAAAARFVAENLSPEEFFQAFRSEAAITQATHALKKRWDGRKYLSFIREACANNTKLGNHVQRRIVME